MSWLANHLVNGMYPSEYFQLANVETTEYEPQYFWASKSRFASYNPTEIWSYLAVADGGVPTSEYLIIDLDRLRHVNYLTFDIMQMPVSISVEYDSLSSGDGDHVWESVTPRQEARFDSTVFYRAEQRNIFSHPEFFFTDVEGNTVVTRYIRLRFDRRDEAWPTVTTTPFKWSIILRSLRVARQVDTSVTGVLFDTGIEPSREEVTLSTIDADKSTQARQRFVVASDHNRGTISPSIAGVSFLVQNNGSYYHDGESGLWYWQIHDVTVPSKPELLRQGSCTTSPASREVWANAQFKKIDVSPNQVFELRAWSGSPRVSDKVMVQAPNLLPGTQLPGSWPFIVNSPNVDVTGTTEDAIRAIISQGDLIQVGDGDDGCYTIDSIAGTTVTLTDAFRGAGTRSEWTASYAYSLTPLADEVRPTVSNGHYYRVSAIAGGGMSGGAEPTWPTESGATVVDNEVTWEEYGLISDPVDVYRVYSLFLHDGDTYELDQNRTMILRVLGDVIESGTDLLGNKYRYGTRYESAENVFDGTLAGWTCEPQPSPLAVQSLYFDVRADNGTNLNEAVLDGLRIAPRTPGVRMQVYYSRGNAYGRSPETEEEWDKLYWEPINQTYFLRGDKVYEFPSQIKCSYLKLEFSNLRPILFETPAHPVLPPREYKRYPTWVEAQFQDPIIADRIANWFLNTRTVEEQSILDLMNDPMKEFEFKQRKLFTEISKGNITIETPFVGEIIDTQQQAYIDPVTASKINFTANRFNGSLIAYIDGESVLGRLTTGRFDPNLADRSVERPVTFSSNGAPLASTSNNRVQTSFAHMAETPMWFNRACRHDYKLDLAPFEGQAFIVGINEIELLRSDYTTTYDDLVISDSLGNEDMLLAMTFEPDNTSGLEPGTVVWVTYYVDGVQYEEEVTIPDIGFAPLSQIGSPATNILVFSQEGRKGTQYFFLDDYDMSYTTSPIGTTINMIARSKVINRWVVPRDRTEVYSDAEVVSMFSTIFGDTDSSDMLVTMFSSLTAEEGHFTSDGYEITYDSETITLSSTIADTGEGSYSEIEFNFTDYDDVEASFTDYDDIEDGI